MTYKSRWDTLPGEIKKQIYSYNNTKLTADKKREYGIAETDEAWFNNNNELYVKSGEDRIRKLIADAREERKNSQLMPVSSDIEKNLKKTLRNMYREDYQKNILKLFGVNKNGGNKKNKPVIYKKKIILGKERSVYKISGSRKDYLKYKGNFITVKDFISSKR